MTAGPRLPLAAALMGCSRCCSCSRSDEVGCGSDAIGKATVRTRSEMGMTVHPGRQRRHKSVQAAANDVNDRAAAVWLGTAGGQLLLLFLPSRKPWGRTMSERRPPRRPPSGGMN